MGGRASRIKGIRAEYLLRDYLRENGYEAVRVPLSGASEGYKSDVVARKEGREYSFEMKSRKGEFKKIYQAYYLMKNRDEKVVRFSYGKEGPLISIGTSFEDVKEPNAHFPSLIFNHAEIYKRFTRSFGKLVRMKSLLGTADYLVIKENHESMLFIKYW